MYQSQQMHPFDYAKHKIADSSNKLYKYLLWAVFLAITLVIILIIALIVIIGTSIASIDPNNIYEIIGTLFTGGAVAITLLVIAGIGLIILMIMIYVQYYKLGSGFGLLHRSDPINENAKYASYGIQGYIVAIILGLFIPGYAGSVISLLGNASLAIGFYFVYKLFVDYKGLGRFNQKPTIMLFIAVAINLITSIVSFFSLYGGIGSIIGFILLVYGFRDLSKDIMVVLPPTAGPDVAQQVVSKTPQEVSVAKTTAVVTETPPTSDAKFCSNCGAKAQPGSKFCENCGSNL